MPKLFSYLESVTEWEAFGYLLLPKDKDYLIKVCSIYLWLYIIRESTNSGINCWNVILDCIFSPLYNFYMVFVLLDACV